MQRHIDLEWAHRSGQSSVLIVAEHGANWEKWVERSLERARNVEVIVRHANERFVNFALRVRDFVRRHREPIAVAVLLSKNDAEIREDEAQRYGWQMIARSVHRVVTGEGDVVFVSPL